MPNVVSPVTLLKRYPMYDTALDGDEDLLLSYLEPEGTEVVEDEDLFRIRASDEPAIPKPILVAKSVPSPIGLKLV